MKQKIIHIDIEWNQTTQEVEMTTQEELEFYKNEISQIEKELKVVSNEVTTLQQGIQLGWGLESDEARLWELAQRGQELATKRKELYQKLEALK